MVLGLSISTFTTIHVIISLIGIATGLVVFYELLASKRLGSWNALFLSTTILTNVTGFMFPNLVASPAVITGILSSIVLAIALFAFYGKHLGGAWRVTYVVTALIALWFNVFVLVVQTFQKVAFFRALAPTQSEPPFLVAQFVVLGLFIWFGVRAARRFHPA